MYFLVTLLSASLQETKTLSEDTTFSKGGWLQCFACIGQPQGSLKKCLVSLKSQLHTGLEATWLQSRYCPLGDVPPYPLRKYLCQKKTASDRPPFFHAISFLYQWSTGQQEDTLTVCSPSASLVDLTVWRLIITNVEKVPLTHFTFGQSRRRNRTAPLHHIQGFLFVS